jgi:hypothetical protein
MANPLSDSHAIATGSWFTGSPAGSGIVGSGSLDRGCRRVSLPMRPVVATQEIASPSWQPSVKSIRTHSSLSRAQQRLQFTHLPLRPASPRYAT